MSTAEARRRELYAALRSRVLTDEELSEVMDMDYLITVRMEYCDENGSRSETFKKQEKQREFNDALYQQARIRALNAKPRVDP